MALRGDKKEGDEAIAEKLALKTGNAKMVFDVGSGFFEVERGELVADSDALLQGVVGGKGQFLSEIGLTGPGNRGRCWAAAPGSGARKFSSPRPIW